MNLLNSIAKSLSIPNLMISESGKEIKTVADFEKRKNEIKKILIDNIYGKIPPEPDSVSVDVVSEDKSFAAGKATLTKLKLTVSMDDRSFTFPFAATIPSKASKENKFPAFIHINFRDSTPDKYMPLEEITDNGFAVFSFWYSDITKDNHDFEDGACGFLRINRQEENASGKIAVWAWAAMRIMDYVSTLEYIDLDNVAVVGHSRLGKTALLAGAFDERFKYTISNDSGCGGAAITRGKYGENIALITGVTSCWFCPKYKDYAGNEDALPFDQHFLLALAAPRHLLVGSAKEDLWADPNSEFLSAHLASEAHRIYGLTGLVNDDTFPTANTTLDAGSICYHIREGKHYFSRYDWNVYINYIKKQMKN